MGSSSVLFVFNDSTASTKTVYISALDTKCSSRVMCTRSRSGLFCIWLRYEMMATQTQAACYGESGGDLRQPSGLLDYHLFNTSGWENSCHMLQLRKHVPSGKQLRFEMRWDIAVLTAGRPQNCRTFNWNNYIKIKPNCTKSLRQCHLSGHFTGTYH